MVDPNVPPVTINIHVFLLLAHRRRLRDGSMDLKTAYSVRIVIGSIRLPCESTLMETRLPLPLLLSGGLLVWILSGKLLP